MYILSKVENFIKSRRMAPTRFGREVAQDPRLVFDLRRGREPGAKLCRKIEAHIAGCGQ